MPGAGQGGLLQKPLLDELVRENLRGPLSLLAGPFLYEYP